jgi:hypothetical protein
MESVSHARTWCLGERYLIGTAPGSRKRGEEAREHAQQLRLAWDGTSLHGRGTGERVVWTDNGRGRHFWHVSAILYCYVQVVMLCV